MDSTRNSGGTECHFQTSHQGVRRLRVCDGRCRGTVPLPAAWIWAPTTLDLYREISFPRRIRYNRPAHGDEGKAALQAFRRLEVGPFFRSVETRRGVLA